MITKNFNARLKQRIDLFSAWENSTLVLLPGELVVAVDDLENPTKVQLKVGNGKDVYKDLIGIIATQEDFENTLKNYFQKEQFLLNCGGADNNFEATDILTEEVKQSIIEEAYDNILNTKF